MQATIDTKGGRLANRLTASCRFSNSSVEKLPKIDVATRAVALGHEIGETSARPLSNRRQIADHNGTVCASGENNGPAPFGDFFDHVGPVTGHHVCERLAGKRQAVVTVHITQEKQLTGDPFLDVVLRGTRHHLHDGNVCYPTILLHHLAQFRVPFHRSSNPGARRAIRRSCDLNPHLKKRFRRRIEQSVTTDKPSSAAAINPNGHKLSVTCRTECRNQPAFDEPKMRQRIAGIADDLPTAQRNRRRLDQFGMISRQPAENWISIRHNVLCPWSNGTLAYCFRAIVNRAVAQILPRTLRVLVSALAA